MTLVKNPKKLDSNENTEQPVFKTRLNSTKIYLQSKCFFLGPIISSVVALQTDFARPCPARLCLAANSRSFIVCPANLPVIMHLLTLFITSGRITKHQHTKRRPYFQRFHETTNLSFDRFFLTRRDC